MHARNRSRIAPLGRGLSLALLTAAMVFTAVSFSHAAETKPAAAAKIPPVTLDTSQLDALKDFGIKAQKVADEWYPRIIEILGAEKSEIPPKVTIVIDLNYDGVAATGGTQIAVSAKYALAHPDDLGMIVHELTHVVQAYPKYDPVWLVEGIADYVRWYNYEPVAGRRRVDPAKAHYNDSYSTTGAFLDWASKKYDKNLVKKLDAALKADTYTPEMFQKSTGKTLDQLGTEWIASLKS